MLEDLGPGHLRLRFSELPDIVRAGTELHWLWVGGATACAEYVGHRASVVLHAERRAEGSSISR